MKKYYNPIQIVGIKPQVTETLVRRFPPFDKLFGIIISLFLFDEIHCPVIPEHTC